MAQRAVVVGAGMAGLRTAEARAQGGYAGEVVVLGDEPHAPYNRPPLSKEALAGELAHERVAFRVRKAAADVVWRLGSRVTRADLAARRVELDDGGSLGFDALVAATGVTARRLAVPGPPPVAEAGRHVVRTLDDASPCVPTWRPGCAWSSSAPASSAPRSPRPRAAWAARSTCVALDPLPMCRPLGPLAAAALRTHHEAARRALPPRRGRRRVRGIGAGSPASGCRTGGDRRGRRRRGPRVAARHAVARGHGSRPRGRRPDRRRAAPPRPARDRDRRRGRRRRPRPLPQPEVRSRRGGSSTGACRPTPAGAPARCSPPTCPATPHGTPTWSRPRGRCFRRSGRTSTTCGCSPTACRRSPTPTASPCSRAISRASASSVPPRRPAGGRRRDRHAAAGQRLPGQGPVPDRVTRRCRVCLRDRTGARRRGGARGGWRGHRRRRAAHRGRRPRCGRRPASTPPRPRRRRPRPR